MFKSLEVFGGGTVHEFACKQMTDWDELSTKSFVKITNLLSLGDKNEHADLYITKREVSRVEHGL